MAKKRQGARGRRKPQRPDCLTPSSSILVKLASIVEYSDAVLEPGGRWMDRSMLDELITDPEVKDWLKQMDAMSLIPKKRE